MLRNSDTPSPLNAAPTYVPCLRPLSVIRSARRADPIPLAVRLAIAQAVYLSDVTSAGVRRLQSTIRRPVYAGRLGVVAATAAIGVSALAIPAPARAAPGNGTPDGPHTPPADGMLTVVVQPGDTLFKLSQRYYGSPDHVWEIARANGSKDPDWIRAGATLKLPGLTAPGQPIAEQASAVVVRPGDTLRRISARVYGDETLFWQIVKANGLQDPDKIFPDMTLKIPLRTAAAADGASVTERTEGQELSFNPPQSQGSARAGGLAAPLPKASFAWPTRGGTVPGGEFGAPRGGGGYPNHTGIDLAAPQGTAVTAAAPGTVTHTGPEGSYGNTVVIDHGNGYKTRYAHLFSWKVNTGATVNQGQLIGLVGSTGYSTGPHLHFEVIKDGKFINPSAVLP